MDIENLVASNYYHKNVNMHKIIDHKCIEILIHEKIEAD